MANELRDKGIAIANEAVQHDNAHRYEEAIKGYIEAAEYLLDATKYEKNPVTLKTIRDKCLEYTERAEFLKESLDSGGKGNAVSAVGVPVAQGAAVPAVLITAESQPEASAAYLANVGAEAAAIQEAFGVANAEVKVNISVSELDRLLAGRSIWCFPGHGDAMLQSEPVLAFVSVGGAIEVVSIDTLVGIVRPHVLTGKLTLIVLTGCCTARLAAALRDRAFVPYVVCWETVLHDEAGRIFGTAFAQAIADGAEPLAAFEKARTAVCTETEPGSLDNRLSAQVQKFELDINPKDATKVDAVSGRLLSHDPRVPRGRLAAGTPKLLRCESTPLHGVPPLPAHYMPRPEQWDLRDALVNGVRGDGTVVGIVGTSLVTGIAGTAGLGKTTTANWLARDPCVRSAFRDGIFWLEFGKERTAMELLMHLAKRLGLGKRPREEDSQILGMDERQSMEEVRDEVALKLQDQCCLIILDDVWEEEQPIPFQQLAVGRVTVLMTTRKSFIVDAFGEQLARLELRPMEDEAATHLLVQSSGKSLEELQGSSLTQLVKMCAGLPAMLRSVGRMCHGRSAEAVDAWFEDYKLSHSLPKSMAKADGYIQDGRKGNLFLAFEGQLEWLKREDDELEKRCTMCAVFPEDTEVPLEILADLWGTGNAETRDAVERLAAEHLVELVADGAMIRLLDPVRDYLRCRGKSALEGWHAHLLGAGQARQVHGDGSGYWDRGSGGGGHFMHHLNGCNGKLGEGSLGAIEELNLPFSVCSADASKLAATLKGTKIVSLNLFASALGPDAVAAIAEGLKGNISLRSLDLTMTQLCGIDPEGEGTYTAEGIIALCEGLKGSAVTLLELPCNQLCGVNKDNEGTYTTEGITKLFEGLKGSAVTSLNIGCNKIGDEGASALAAILKEMMISDLNLENIDLGSKGAAALAEGLKGNSTLQSLNLASNNLAGETGHIKKSEAPDSDGGITMIDLSGFMDFVASLPECGLTSLDLHDNNIGDEGATFLTLFLKETRISKLNLVDNGIGAAGAFALADVLQEEAAGSGVKIEF